MDIISELKRRGQAHLLDVSGLSEEEKKAYLSRLETIDWSVLDSRAATPPQGKISPIAGLRLNEISARRALFEAIGGKAISEGKLACVLLAGGQGTRLNWNGPKGTFDIGITRPLPIFAQLIENLKEVTSRWGEVELLIMTSEINDAETRAFFENHNYFGYPKERIAFFVQQMAPCTDFNGKVLLEARGKLALSPNGNGGWYTSLLRAGLKERLRGVEWLNVFAVDNVLQRIADPVFLGACIESGKACGAKVVTKASPDEKVGVLCLEDGLPSVVEYYELQDEMRTAREGENLLYGFGVTLNYLFRTDRLDAIGQAKIPVHVVKKKIPHMGEMHPKTENGCKFETLILDMVHLMGSCLPFEVEREKEFAPIKNAEGADSVETARALLIKNGVKL